MAEKKKHSYGGQAVIEGVMIRGRTSVVTAVRRPGGEITTNVKPLPSTTVNKARRTPLIRGVVILIEAMVIGIQSLLHSANVSMEEEEEKIPAKVIWGMMAIAAIMAVLLFFIAPLFLTGLINNAIPNSLVFHIIEGVIRLVIFLAYIKVISYLPDIKRVFTYHGAEHKAVNAYEAGVPMEVDAIKTYSKAHVRCGTSFLFLVFIVAIIIFTFVGRQALWLMLLSRVVLLPVIMGIGYEIIYFGARHAKNWLMKIALAPGLWLQAMTTGEPDDKQLEVAIAALNKAVEIDRAEETSQAALPDTSIGP
ncbi:MAG: hypothetical protein A2Y58_02885 [Chloroflexi bacterium RBG_13_51_52]|nr:MAG: hypothetical protein A2Y58_02885 [Chloroflexi bacterium RBG_13_51_52]